MEISYLTVKYALSVKEIIHKTLYKCYLQLPFSLGKKQKHIYFIINANATSRYDKREVLVYSNTLIPNGFINLKI